jgi:hypothetical protein
MATSRRLTDSLRREIAERAAAFAFDPKYTANATEEHTLADRVYRTVISEDVLRRVLALPEGWTLIASQIAVNANGQQITLNFGGDKKMPVPYNVRRHPVEPGELCDAIQANAAAYETLKEQRKAAYRATLAMLSAVNTLKQLEEAWPDGAPFYTDLETSPSNLPAVRVDEINALLGLPQ